MGRLEGGGRAAITRQSSRLELSSLLHDLNVTAANEETMRTVRAAVSTLLAAAAAVAMAPASGAVAESGLASPWSEVHNGRVRLVGGAPAAAGAKAYLAGVEVGLAKGWKTYWRAPGDAGVPPMFEWEGSANVASVKVLYPAPSRLREPVAESIGYKDGVLFPVEVVPKDASKPAELALNVEFGICRDICIPAQAKLSLTLPPAALSERPSPQLLAALESVPRQRAARRPADPQLKSARAVLVGAAPRLVFEATFPRGADGAELFVEAPDGLYLPMSRRLRDGAAPPVPTADANDDLVRFEVDLSRTSNARDLEGKTLTLTLVSDAGAAEVAWKVP
jgi:DsbC/DsbD-like thiol-disulfide interchange protein